jgi:glycerophosphoryl diester phosphodiesterase
MEIQLIAHRGASAIAPENTLAAFQLAVSKGAAGVEFDLQLTSEGVPVVIHDSTLNRTTNGQGKVRDHSLTELKRLDAGKWFDVKFTGEKIPTLQEVLNLLKDTDLLIFPELKGTSSWSIEDLQYCLDLIINQGWRERCRLLCFDWDYLQIVQKLYPDLSLGFNCLKIRKKLQLQQILASQCSLSVDYRFLLNHPKLIDFLQSQQREIMTWTVDDLETIKALSHLGIKKIISNRIFDEKED